MPTEPTSIPAVVRPGLSALALAAAVAPGRQPHEAARLSPHTSFCTTSEKMMTWWADGGDC